MSSLTCRLQSKTRTRPSADGDASSACQWLEQGNKPSKVLSCFEAIIKRLIVGCLIVAPLLALSWPASLACGQEATDSLRHAAKVLPSNTFFLAHINSPDKQVALLEDHPTLKKLLQIESVQEAIQSEQFQQFQAGLSLAEFRLSMKWREFLRTTAGNGLTLAVGPQQGSLILLVQGQNEDDVRQLYDESAKAMRLLSQQGEANEDRLRSVEHRGIQAWQLGDAAIFRLGSMLVATNNFATAKAIIDQDRDASQSLLDNARFVAGLNDVSRLPLAWAWVDLTRARDAGIAKELFADRSTNIAAELLFGGIQGALRQSEYLTLELQLDDQRLRVNLATPFDSDSLAGPREFYFGAMAKGRAPEALQPRHTMLNLVTHRDLAALWLGKEELFEERALAALSQTDSNLSTLFGGVDFGEEILGATKPEIQVVASRQTFENRDTPVPAIKLPAFAVIFQLHDPKQVERQFKIAFQSVIGFVNIGLGQQGQPQLEIVTNEIQGARVTSATHFVDPDDEEGRINYNFSPSMLISGDRLVLSSTRELANELAGLIQSHPIESRSEVNTSLRAESSVLHDVLHDNRNQLIAQNMLEEGHDRAEAQREVDTLLQLVELTQGLNLELKVESKQLQLTAELQFDAAQDQP